MLLIVKIRNLAYYIYLGDNLIQITSWCKREISSPFYKYRKCRNVFLGSFRLIRQQKPEDPAKDIISSDLFQESGPGSLRRLDR